MKKMLKDKNNQIYFGFFLFFLILFSLSPISGDDWGNYLEGSKGFHHMIGQAIGMYFTWEGRLVSRLFINILTINKWLWNILNTFVILGIIYFSNKLIKFKHKETMLLLSFLIILFMNLFTFSQVIVWIAGNITYLFVIPLLLLYVNLLYQKSEWNKKETIFLILLNIIIPMFVEHMAILLILLNLYFLGVDYYKSKKVNKKILVFFLISVISFSSMYFSPGNRIRSEMENLEFNELSIFGKVFYNLPNFIFYTYEVNTFLIILMVIGNTYLIKKQIKKKRSRVFLYLLEGISLLFSGIYLLESFGFIKKIGMDNNPFVILYFIFLTIIHFVFLVRNSKKIEADLPILFYGMGIVSNLVMLLSPTWGYRTCFGAYLFLSICYLIIIDQNMKKNKYRNKGIILITILGIVFYLIFYVSIHNAYLENKKRIEEANKNHSKVIELIAYPGFAPCNINPTNDFHLSRFKEYYKIEKDVEIRTVKKNWKYVIIYQNK